MIRLIDKLEEIIVWSKTKLEPNQFIFLSSVLVGISAAFAVIILKYFAHQIFVLATYMSSILKLGFLNSFLPIIGILLTVFVIKRFLGGSIKKGTSQILYAVTKKSSIIPKKQMYAQIITSSLTVGLGGSAGLESPIVITGAAFGSNYAQKYKLCYKDRTLLIGCGVAAGIAAAFNAPIAGVLFAIEVLLVDVSIAAFTPIMISAATGALVSVIILDETILLRFRLEEDFNYHNIPYYLILGVLTGLTSIYYSRNFQRIEHFFNQLQWGQYQKALFGSCLLAILIFIFPSFFGEGYESIKILSEKDPNQLLDNTLFSKFKTNDLVFVFFVGCTMMAKVFASGLTIGSGGNGGNFAPSLFLGSYLGFLFSKLINLSEFTNLPVSNFTIVGMAGILSGLFHAPLTAIFLIAEITGGYNLMIPLMIVSSISFAISRRFEKHSMDIKNLIKRGHTITSNKDSNILSTIDLESIVQTDYLTFLANDNLDFLKKNILSVSNQPIFAVVDDDNKLNGVVLYKDIALNASINTPLKVSDIMSKSNEIISTDDTMEIVMNKFDVSESSFLPVIKDDRYYGFISKCRALEAYRDKIKTMTID